MPGEGTQSQAESGVVSAFGSRMDRLLVSGLINIETTLRVDGFPIPYAPTRYPFFGVNSTVSGVGYNIAKALTTLGAPVDFLSIIGRDLAARTVAESLAADGIDAQYIVNGVEYTAQSIIAYDPDGRRAIFVDLKDIQEQAYPADLSEAALAGCDIAVLCNINFSRSMLVRARAAGKCVATDVHAIADLDDEYNRDFMQHADILFMSHERLPCLPEIWAARVQARYGNAIIVIGLGAEGALLSVKCDKTTVRIPVVHVRPVVNTIGAGDALFSAFLFAYRRTRDPYDAIRRATVFAAYKVGARGAAEGFLNADELDAMYRAIYHP